jgi:hypothetical protein
MIADCDFMKGRMGAKSLDSEAITLLMPCWPVTADAPIWGKHHINT